MKLKAFLIYPELPAKPNPFSNQYQAIAYEDLRPILVVASGISDVAAKHTSSIKIEEISCKDVRIDATVQKQFCPMKEESS